METRQVNLTDAERALLDALLLDSSARARRRSRIVLDWASGKEIMTIARELPTRRARAERVVNAFIEKRLDIFTTAARKRAITPTVPAPVPKPSLHGHTTMRDAAHQILARQFEKLRQCEEEVRRANDPEAVHDMRVACRRLNSAFRLFRADLPTKPVKRLRPTLEKLRDSLGAARNLDVLIQDLEEFCANLPPESSTQLQAVSESWRQERARQQQVLVKLLDSAAYDKWRGRMVSFLAQQYDDASPRVAHVVPALVWKQYGAVRAYETRFATASLEELHALRIEIKRLRYTLEFFRDVFKSSANLVPPDLFQSKNGLQSNEAAPPDDSRSSNEPLNTQESNDHGAGELIETLVALQDQLGSIQDAVVAGQALTDFIIAQAHAAKKSSTPLPEFQAIAGYHGHLNARIEELRSELPEQWNTILSHVFRQHLAVLTANL